MEIVGIDWFAFLSLAGSAGILSAIIGAALQYMVSALERRRRARFLQMQLSAIFEEYAEMCLRAVMNNNNFVGSRGAFGEEIGRLPMLPPLPTSPEVWPLVKANLADKALRFGTEVSRANTILADTWDIVGDDDDDEIILQHLEVGHEAMILSRDLRQEIGLQQTELAQEMLPDIATRLSSHRAELEADKKRRAETWSAKLNAT